MNCLFMRITTNCLAAGSLAELIDKKVTEFSNEELSAATVMAEIGMTNTVIITALGQGQTDDAIWDDEDTRTFYESLPDLRAILPAVLFEELNPKAVRSSHSKSL
jgi:hypothetical protein